MIRRDVPPERVIEHAIDIQPHLDELWVVEDLPFAGGVSQMAAILEATQDVVVGHGIAPAPFRTAAALAMEWATLERMYPGRLSCGLGHGVQSWMSQIGERVDSPLTLIGETCAAVRSLLARETVNASGRYVTVEGVRLEFPPIVPPLVSLGVVGPKSLELSGELADGTILGEGHGPDEIQAALARIRAGRQRSVRRDGHRVTVFAAFHVGTDDDIVRNPDAPVGWEAVSSDSSQVARSLVALFEAGAHSVVLVPLASNPVAGLAVAIEHVVPELRNRLATLGVRPPVVGSDLENAGPEPSH